MDVHCTVTLYDECTMYIVHQWVLYCTRIVHCTMPTYLVHSTMYSVQCTLVTILYRVYNTLYFSTSYDVFINTTAYIINIQTIIDLLLRTTTNTE